MLQHLLKFGSHQAKGKWKQSSKDFSQHVIAEEIRLKYQQNTRLKEEMHKIYSDISHSYSTIRYLSILHILTKLREKHYKDVMFGHDVKKLE